MYIMKDLKKTKPDAKTTSPDTADEDDEIGEEDEEPLMSEEHRAELQEMDDEHFLEGVISTVGRFLGRQ